MHSQVPQIPPINSKEKYLKIPNPKQTLRIFGQMERFQSVYGLIALQLSYSFTFRLID